MSMENEENVKKTAEPEKSEDTAGLKPKKKKYIKVLRPQNASSKEVRNIAKRESQRTTASDSRTPQKAVRKVIRRADGTLVTPDGRIVRRKNVPAPECAPVSEPEEKAEETPLTQAETETIGKKEPALAQPETDSEMKKSSAKKAEASAEIPESGEAPEKKTDAETPKKTERAASGRAKTSETKEKGREGAERTRERRTSEKPARGSYADRGSSGRRAPAGTSEGERPSFGEGRKRTDKKTIIISNGDTPGRRQGRNSGKDRDKNKDSLRENKYTTDRRQGGGRSNQGRKQQNLVPKAMQKPSHKQHEEKKEVVTEITIPERITIGELAGKMKIQPAVIVKKLFMEGTMATVNQEIDYEKAAEIALSFDILAEEEEKVDVIEELLKDIEDDEPTLTPRPPVVCVMGHVDHGKTSLLDAIRHAHVTDVEAGGITQHIGAYVVPINGRKITFLDTPGHEAFTAMRMRGANSTDIAILVVAADDGVMPQTVEAINHAKAAGVEVIVAINKIDKPGANVDRVKQELTEHGLISEDWGGSTIFVPVSAKTHEGLDDLLEMILLTADVLELKANKNRKARGLVLEAKLDKGKGPVANVLVQKGTLKVGDYIAAGACSGRVRAMMDENSKNVKEALPSMPVEVVGLNGVPNAGEILVATASDKEAKNFAATFVSEDKSRLVEETRSRMSLDDLFSQIQEGNLKELNLIVKADVQGSVEAMKQSLLKLSNDEVVVKVIHGGVGAISESDVTLAATSNAIIIGFNVRPDATARTIAEQEGVDIRLYKVIYQAIEDVENAMKGMLEPVYEEKVIGHVEIRQIFKASGVGNIAGSYVLDGVVKRDCGIRITREDELIYEGSLASLKRFKDDVKEVKAGFECGLVFKDFDDIAPLDQVEAFEMVEVPRQ